MSHERTTLLHGMWVTESEVRDALTRLTALPTGGSTPFMDGRETGDRMMMKIRTFDDLVGQTLVSVANPSDEAVVFTLDDGSVYELSHSQDCCESVTVESIEGGLSDLVGPVLSAYESSGGNDRADHIHPTVRVWQSADDYSLSAAFTPPLEQWDESWTWTFYRISTVKGTVVIRWYGVSNGYYSESVQWREVR